MRRVVIVGAGFVGLNCARDLGGSRDHEVVVVDRRNHYVFQPLLYQVAMAELSPADIALPIRGVLSRYANLRVLQAEARAVDLDAQRLHTDAGDIAYDELVLATGAQHAYFGREDWEPFAPGLKTLEQATEIRRRVLSAFEAAERSDDPAAQRRHLTFVIVGAGPTGVELAGAIAEMARFTLARDFRRVDPTLARVVLVEAGPRVLATFQPRHSDYARRALNALGVDVRCDARVTAIDADGVALGGERVPAATVLWAAGVNPSALAKTLGVPLDRTGRVIVQPDLSLPGRPEVFVAGDLAHVEQDGRVLPGVADVAKQQGHYLAALLRREARGRPRRPFHFLDLGRMATIGHDKAIADFHRASFTGYFAWLLWALLHIYRLIGFKSRLVVMLQWAWTYWTNRRGARLILGKDWRSYPDA